MNIGQLKALIADLDDAIEIYQIIHDHEARKVEIGFWKVTTDGVYTGQYFPRLKLQDGEAAIPALIVEI